jgi:penicillin-binding protein 1A
MILRIFGYLFGIGAVFFLLVAGAIAWYVSGLAEDLPDFDVLAKYEPPVMTRIHAADGQLVAEYAHERRLYLPIQAIPDRVRRRSSPPRTRTSTTMRASTITASPAP